MNSTRLLQTRLVTPTARVFQMIGKNNAAAPVQLRAFSTGKPVNQDKPLDSEFVKKHRPISPHFTIYQPQITWYGSIIHRITGAGFATLFYAGVMTYAVGDFNTAALVSTVGALPVGVKVAGKFILAWPFMYHSFNGIRHLVWDAGRCLTNQGVINSGYLAIGSSAAAALGLACM
ncbi:hypothetical protein K493DRAFT_312237 [Basidiobolus meristosporus CBS 931.73]|uniref:Cytochrome b560 subunit of succinate dehydrogenase n=1 Tax=Basidiobolus meristosporus CBS 931.73 TaxID=1314790 RepID=A0A1Y1YUX8_9FUNG|nr:hypothetical protein K493DRAFT_312237 [Basidiobolus meristosporus CBS 931.73]|eukprot:ORY01843.1 hypothetical protein K493DRAFT_312237 [Basidiobolus meristosporus CBS 931.73]